MDQWFITFETLVEFFGFFLPEKYTTPVKSHMLLLGVGVGGSTPYTWIPEESQGGGRSVDNGKPCREQQDGREELWLKE